MSLPAADTRLVTTQRPSTRSLCQNRPQSQIDQVAGLDRRVAPMATEVSRWAATSISP
jgi:hypothetical protein